MNDYSQHVVLDLFAGHGVGVGIRNLGAKDLGVEWNPAAVATRELNGMETVYSNVWDAHLAEDLSFDTLWASPPCQQFSLAGSGAGRRALTDVLGVIARKQYTDMAELREQAALLGDEKIGLVLSPLYYVHRFRPTYVAFEQVPPVLPAWEAMADEMRAMGYSVWTGKLHAEQFGVPQTRTRAILMARLDGPVSPPVPTHSKYYSRDPERLDEGVAKWVSMEDALSWPVNAEVVSAQSVAGGDRAVRAGQAPGLTVTQTTDRARVRWPENRPAPTVTGGGTASGGAEPFGPGGRNAIRKARREQLR